MRITISIGITAIMLLLVLALPVTASDYTLEIFGNANEDETINMQDVTYTELIILEYRDKTKLSDAKYDGKINMQDVTQIELVILGREKEITLIDTAEKVVTVNKPLTRILPTYPQAIETLRSIKVPKDIIVGIGTWPTPLDPVFFGEFSDTPCIGTGWNPDVEAILELDPDAVILFGIGRVDLDPVQDVLEVAGITVLRFNLQTLDIHRAEVEKLGYVFDKRDCAEEYLNWRADILDSIEESVFGLPEDDKPNVYFMPSFNDGLYYIYGRYAYIDMAGGSDVFADQPGNYMSLDPEEVITRNPDIIVRVAPWDAGGYGVAAGETAEFEAIKDEIMSQPELENVEAVNDGEVYIIADHFVSFFPASGCRQFVQIAYQAKWFHPELFEDLDPEAIHQEYLTEYQGLDYDLSEQGVFVYPPLEEGT